jgi:hypothetical protein
MKVLIGRYPSSAGKERKVNIRIDKWDTWSMDHTLALIVHPMLVQLKATNHGAGMVDDEDVPQELRSTSAPPVENEWDTDDNLFKRWDWVMDEMIWAFSEQVSEDGDSIFFDYSDVEDNDAEEWDPERYKKIKIDHEGLTAYRNRKQNAFRLFGKYYQNLWD